MKARILMGRFCHLPALLILALPASASGQEVEVTSEVPTILATSLSDLPEGPGPQRQNDNCDNTFKAAKTEAGRYVEERGWGVMSEEPVGPFQLVSFGGEFIPGTSGSCAIHQGNVGVFEDGQIIALLYTENETDELIGELVPKEGGALRLWTGEYLRRPVADLVVDADGLLVAALSQEESFCEGAVSVPNIYGEPITEARETLIAGGWEPIPQKDEGFGQEGLHDIGITETISCAGTGFGYCSYAYRNAKASLSLTSVGELYEGSVPEVVYYEVGCGAR
jgi:hypothetical protein